MRILVVVSLQLALILVMRSPLKADGDAKDIAGYDKTMWGMTEEEVLAAEAPLAERLEKPSTMVNGDIVTIVIRGIEIAGIQFSGYFIFDPQDRKLIAVGLQSAMEMGASVGSIEKYLTEKYGQPANKKEGENLLWELPKTTIELVTVDLKLPITKPVRMILISYRSTQGGGAGSRQSLDNERLACVRIMNAA